MPRPAWFDAVAAPVLRATRSPRPEELQGELLREWGSSEVWRFSYGLRSVVAKRGTDNQYAEAAAYERFVVPLALPAPEIVHLERQDGAALLVLTDVGRVTLEQEPSVEGFLTAARLLADVRAKPVEQQSEFDGQRLADLADRLEILGDPLRAVLVDRAAPALDRLHDDAPVTVVHGDFVPKNLVTDGERWTVIDWPAAYLAPHLGDLYTLLREAVALGHNRDGVVARYLDASGNDPRLVGRQLTLGGICFSLLALTWIVEEGVRTAPISTDWIEPLRVELAGLVQELP